jgi:hypothetical protein
VKTINSIKFFSGIVIFAILMTTGCSALKPIEHAPSDRARLLQERRPSPVYYDFDDVLIPGELKPNRRISSVSQTETISTGVLSLSGKIEIEALFQFFKNNMAKDNWRSVSGLTGSRSLLLFEKGNRWCVIIMAGDGYGTRVDVWVAPRNN